MRVMSRRFRRGIVHTREYNSNGVQRKLCRAARDLPIDSTMATRIDGC